MSAWPDADKHSLINPSISRLPGARGLSPFVEWSAGVVDSDGRATPALAMRSKRSTSWLAARKPSASIALRARAFAVGSNTDAQGRSVTAPSSPKPRSTSEILPAIQVCVHPHQGMLSPHTGLGGAMAGLHSLLAVYAAFDRSVIEANNPEWSRLVESFLPGTTGENQRGWSNDVEQLVSRLSPNPLDPQQLQLQHALVELNDVATQLATRAYGDQPEEDTEPPLVSVTHISQLLYAIAVGRTLAYRAPATSVDFSLFTDDS